MMRRSKKSNRCFPPRRETSVHPPAWTLIGRQALWWVIMSRFLYQKESSLKYWIVIPQWEVDNDKLLPLIYLLALHSHTARRHSCITNCWQRCWQMSGPLPDVGRPGLRLQLLPKDGVNYLLLPWGKGQFPVLRHYLWLACGVTLDPSTKMGGTKGGTGLVEGW